MRTSLKCIIAFAMLLPLPVLARPANCLLEVMGVHYIKGKCKFYPSYGKDGSFQISGGKYFADVQISSPGHAEGFWNEEPGVSHAHSNLGSLKATGACWINASAKVCAWRPGERAIVPPTPHGEEIIIRGTISSGTLDSSIGDYGFITQSPVGDAIFKSCKLATRCEIRARVQDKFINRVTSVTPIVGD